MNKKDFDKKIRTDEVREISNFRSVEFLFSLKFNIQR